MDANVATMLEAVSESLGDTIALRHGDNATTWAEFDRRASRIARHLSGHGVRQGDAVAVYLYNTPAYLETVLAAFKLRATPVNVNYRYGPNEVAYLLQDARAKALVFDSSLSDTAATATAAAPTVLSLLSVGESTRAAAVHDYEQVASCGEMAPRVERSGDDTFLIYTGGTTGMPKGVIWTCREFFGFAVRRLSELTGMPVPRTAAEVGDHARALRNSGEAPIHVQVSPLMHGAGFGASLVALLLGGTVITLGRRFDPDEVWRAVEKWDASQISIVGDAFARPMVHALDTARTAGRPYALRALRRIQSSGAMWSAAVKKALLDHVDVTLVDGLSSTEALGLGSSAVTRQSPVTTAAFAIGPRAVVLTEDGRHLTPGSDEIGLLAVKEPLPVGYHNDPAKSAALFREVNSIRYVVPGDWARVEADGTIALLGRGSSCINSGGEKIFPEEVEEAIKTLPGVDDCLVIGTPDERWGEVVTAVVAPDSVLDLHELGAALGDRIAAYKHPRRLIGAPSIARHPSGKPDYEWARRLAAAASKGAGTAEGGTADG